MRDPEPKRWDQTIDPAECDPLDDILSGVENDETGRLKPHPSSCIVGFEYPGKVESKPDKLADGAWALFSVLDYIIGTPTGREHAPGILERFKTACECLVPELRAGHKKPKTPKALADVASVDGRVMVCIRRLLTWAYMPGNPTSEGQLMRSIVCGWYVLPQLNRKNETELAQMFGKKKQSLNRCVVDFKSKFPHFKAPHTSHD